MKIKCILNVNLCLQYLHNEKKLLHGDMKSCNVVIGGDFETVKICDVGVSLVLDENMRGKTYFTRNCAGYNYFIQMWL